VDVLTNPGFQRSLQIVLAIVAAVGGVMFLAVLWSARRPMSAQARVLRRRVGAIGLFVLVAAAAALAVLAVPVEPAPGGGSIARESPPQAPSTSGDDVATGRRFSSARPPALSLDAPDGWTLALDAKARKLAASSDGARLTISTAVLSDAVDVEALLAQLASTQRTLGFDVGATFTERIDGLTAAGFVATGPARSVCTWMIKRDTHLATSVICTAEGKTTAHDACRAVLAEVRWRTPASAR
jgi:hypothetical protein